MGKFSLESGKDRDRNRNALQLSPDKFPLLKAALTPHYQTVTAVGPPLHSQLPVSQPFLPPEILFSQSPPKPCPSSSPAAVCVNPLPHALPPLPRLSVTSPTSPHLSFKASLQSLAPFQLLKLLLKQSFASETVGALSMSWLFKHVHLPRDAGAESDFERTDPTTFFEAQVLLEPFLETLALQHWLLQKSLSVAGNLATLSHAPWREPSLLGLCQLGEVHSRSRRVVMTGVEFWTAKVSELGPVQFGDTST